MRAHTVRSTIAACACAIAMPSVQASAQLTPEDHAAVVARINMLLHERYVFPDVAAAMGTHLQQRLRSSAYAAITDRGEFARTLTDDLRSVSKDKHLGVRVKGQQVAGPTPRRPSGPVVTKRVLDGNIGYIGLTLVQPPDRMGDDLRAAMRTVKDADALILDLRDNGGGSPDGVSLIAGYLIPERTLLARIYSRPTNDTTYMWSSVVDGPHFTRDVYILTNTGTFSAAEAVAYHLKHLGRARIVGEPSGGGAHRISSDDLPANLFITVPFTRPLNAVSGGDWEGTGVMPDVAVPAERALDVAHLAALRALPETDARRHVIRRLSGN